MTEYVSTKLMAPKKKNKEIDPEVKLSPEENNISLSQEVKILERELVVYREEAAKVSSVELELRARVEVCYYLFTYFF